MPGTNPVLVMYTFGGEIKQLINRSWKKHKSVNGIAGDLGINGLCTKKCLNKPAGGTSCESTFWPQG